MNKRPQFLRTRQVGRSYLLFLIGLILVLMAAFNGAGLEVSQAQEETEICTMEELPVSKPLTELAGEEYVRMDGQQTGFTGGLYPDGSNQRPAAHEADGLAAASQIVPLDAAGQPDAANGKIVFISVGMSNTTHEWIAFESLVHRNPLVNPKIALINGAQGGRTAERWVDPASETYTELNARLRSRDLTPQQVQVAWIKQTTTRGGDFPAKAQELQTDLEAIARNLLVHYPNIKIAYFSSRTRSYTYWRGLSPEPNAFETGFSVKWLVEKQIGGDPLLNFDPAQGDVVAPYITWGPYLWINGTTPRLDGRIWEAQDMAKDCTHPTASGTGKVAEMMLEYFLSDATSVGWFSASGQASSPAGAVSPPVARPSPTPGVTATATATITATALMETSPTSQPAQSSATMQPAPATDSPAASQTPSSGASYTWIILALLAGVLLGAGGAWVSLRRKT